MKLGIQIDKADISFQGKQNRRIKCDGKLDISVSGTEKGIMSKYVSISGNMKKANTNTSIKVTVMIKQIIRKIEKNSKDICIKGNNNVYKCTRTYSKPVRRVNMWYVNKCSTLCTQSGSQQLENVQAQVSRVTQSSKSSKIADKCSDISLYRLVSNTECKGKISAYVISPCKGRKSLINMTARKEKKVERNSSIKLVKKRYGIVRSGISLCNVKCK
jgi:hypothetical protein